MPTITKGNLDGISSKGGYWKNGKFYPNPVSATDPLYILYGYPVASTGGGEIIEAGTKSNYTYEDDGHGVVTSRVTFYGSSPNEIANGSSHPKLGASLKCFRSSTSQDGKVYTTTAEYIGLANGATSSNAVLSGDFGVSSAPITQCKYADGKGIFTSANGWDNNRKEFVGIEGQTGSAADPLNLKGTKSFLTPSLTISGYFYTTNAGQLSQLIGQVGKATNALKFPGDDSAFYSDLPGGGRNRSNKFFISGVSHERIAHLYKIKFSIIWCGDGWSNSIYPTA